MAEGFAVFFFAMFAIAAAFMAWFAFKATEADRERSTAIDEEERTRRELEPLRKYEGIRNVEAAQVKMIEKAAGKREEILESARTIREKALKLQSIAKSLRNTIDGYGDRYLEPNQSVIDELADEYSHKKAGQELKDARAYSRALVREGNACTSSPAALDEIAKAAGNLVLEVFNERVQDVLARSKVDDFGTLRQRIRDAAELSNKDGSKICQTEIVSVYVNARIAELKWVVAVRELKREEKEEQRSIRAQIKEEAKAERELLKKIEKEEEEERIVHDAMERLKDELQQANDAEVQDLESRLAEMQMKIQEIEAEKERAISQAQITRKGHIYVISNIGSFGEGVYKVGLTRRLDPEVRIKELGDASVPFEFDVHAILSSDDSPALEKELHHALHEYRVNKVNNRKEFFRIDLKTIRSAIESYCQDAQWTKYDEKIRAHEYRQTLAEEARRRGEAVPLDMISSDGRSQLDDLDRTEEELK